MPEAKSRQTLNVDLGELKPLVEAAAKNQGKRPGGWVRDAVVLALQEQQALPAQVARVAANREPGAAVVHFSARLTAVESKALRAAAGAEGLSQAEYVARMAQGTLVPQRHQVVAELGVLNAGLQAIGQDLKGMAARAADPAVQKLLQSTARLVRAQMRQVAQSLGEVSATRRRGGGG
ncbi:hypothetical protein [Azohydromonas australica]|uniref:hypothetical protein n=1 Tax=Azohydromonas australica TaxID=364039 RepID=UPI00048BD87A|nr:hypothetical protein [Azohydromonas australica]